MESGYFGSKIFRYSVVGLHSPLQNHMILSFSCSCIENIDVFSQFGDLVLMDIFLPVGIGVYGPGLRTVLRFYGHGIQPFLLCVLSIALSVTSVSTTDSFVVSSWNTYCPEDRALRR